MNRTWKDMLRAFAPREARGSAAAGHPARVQLERARSSVHAQLISKPAPSPAAIVQSQLFYTIHHQPSSVRAIMAESDEMPLKTEEILVRPLAP